jgi:hypothetical protein
MLDVSISRKIAYLLALVLISRTIIQPHVLDMRAHSGYQMVSVDVEIECLPVATLSVGCGMEIAGKYDQHSLRQNLTF